MRLLQVRVWAVEGKDFRAGRPAAQHAEPMPAFRQMLHPHCVHVLASRGGYHTSAPKQRHVANALPHVSPLPPRSAHFWSAVSCASGGRPRLEMILLPKSTQVPTSAATCAPLRPQLGRSGDAQMKSAGR